MPTVLKQSPAVKTQNSQTECAKGHRLTPATTWRFCGKVRCKLCAKAELARMQARRP